MEPMTMMAIGSAIAGGASSIFGGRAQSAAMQQANQQAYQRWVQSNTQKTISNAREQFQSAFQATQQLKRNASIAKAAWETQWDSTQALNTRSNYQQKQLANQIQSQKSALLNAVISKGVSSSSGTYAALATAQSLDAIQNASMLKKNTEIELQNINKQTQAMLSQQTENIFMPNIQLPDFAPIFGDTSAAERGGMISGLLQIGSAVGASTMGFSGNPGATSPILPYSERTSSTTGTSTMTFNENPNNLDSPDKYNNIENW